ncbi:MAG: mRNA surveillance protein pelota [Candidatus Diapherotrites archaeon]
MKILKIDKKNNTLELIPENFEDLWHIQKIIEKGDKIKGESERKIKPRQEGEKTIKQKIYVEIETEKTDFHETTNQLRITGKITSMKPEEDMEKGAMHTIEATPNTKITIQKQKLKQYHIERLEKAKNSTKKGKIIAIAMDDEEAEITQIKDTNISTKTKIKSGKQGKRYKQEEKKENYYKEIIQKIKEEKPDTLIILGPGFERQDFEKYLKENHKEIKAIFEGTKSAGIQGIKELINTGKIDKIIEGLQSTEEEKSLQKLMKAIAEEKATIGQKETKEALEKAAIEELIISEKMLSEKKEEAEEMLEKAEQTKTKIIFINQKSEAGKTIESLGGIAGILRYKTKWN